MHKTKKSRIQQVPKVEKPKTKWKKYLIVPLLLGAATVVVRPYFGPEADPYTKYLADHGIKTKEIEKSMTFDSCKFFIVGERSEAIRKLRNYDDFDGATEKPILGDDGRLRGIVVISERAKKATPNLAYDNIDSGVAREAREFMASAAATGNRNVTIIALTKITSASLIGGSQLEVLYKQIESSIGSEPANDFLMRKIGMLTFFDYASRKVSDFGGVNFVNTMMHEAMHCAVENAVIGKNLPKIDTYNHEILAYTGEIVYGQNPWLSLMRVMSFAQYYYINSATEKYGFEYKRSSGDMPQKLSDSFIIMLYDVFNRISDKGGISSPLDFIGKSDEQLRKAAKESLDEQSRRLLGTDFDKVLSTAEIEKIRESASNYVNKR
jgi:hypothetical protein